MNLTVIYHCGLTDNAKAFYREFARQGVKVTAIVPKKINLDPIQAKTSFLTVSESDFESAYNLIAVDLINIHRYNLGFHPRQLLKALKSSEPELIQVFNEYPSLTTVGVVFCRNLLYRRRVPVVSYSFQNIRYNTFPFLFGFSLKGLGETLKRLLIYPLIFAYNRRYIDGVTGASREAIENIKAIHPGISAEHIFWGVDFKNFCSKDANLCRRKLRLPEDIKLVAYVGRLIKEKGLDKLLEAVSRSNYHLMLIGDGDYESALNKRVSSLGIKDRVHRRNSLSSSELVNYYNCFDALVLPSQTTFLWKEQYGKVLAEAMACNISIIGSSSGAIPEVLEGYPKHLIFREDSVDDLIDKISKIESLDFPENFNISNFLNKFSVDYFVSKHIEFYKTLINTISVIK